MSHVLAMQARRRLKAFASKAARESRREARERKRGNGSLTNDGNPEAATPTQQQREAAQAAKVAEGLARARAIAGTVRERAVERIQSRWRMRRAARRGAEALRVQAEERRKALAKLALTVSAGEDDGIGTARVATPWSDAKAAFGADDSAARADVDSSGGSDRVGGSAMRAGSMISAPATFCSRR